MMTQRFMRRWCGCWRPDEILAKLFRRSGLQSLCLLVLGFGFAPAACSVTYLTQEQALALAFEKPAEARCQPLVLDAAHRRAVEEKLDAPMRQRAVLAYTGILKSTQAPGAALFDAVIGKHEFIDYMVVLDGRGRVKFIEILAYRESYGGQVRGPSWRGQFVGRSEKEPPEHEKNIVNISGATLSCRHVTEGVRKLLAVASVYAAELGLQPESTREAR